MDDFLKKTFASGARTGALVVDGHDLGHREVAESIDHFVVPGGGVKLAENGDALAWQATPTNFLFHHGTLIRVDKAKLADQLRAEGLYDSIPSEAWKGKFVVDIKPVGDGRAVLQYLALYVHRVAISDQRILEVDERSVKFSYIPSGSSFSRTRRVTGEEFVRGLLQQCPSAWNAKSPTLRLDELEQSDHGLLAHRALALPQSIAGP